MALELPERSFIPFQELYWFTTILYLPQTPFPLRSTPLPKGRLPPAEEEENGTARCRLILASPLLGDFELLGFFFAYMKTTTLIKGRKVMQLTW